MNEENQSAIQKIIKSLQDPKAGGDEIFALLTNIAKVMIQFIMGVALVFFIISAIQMITSSGDQAKVANAKKSMLYIVIGILLGIGSLAFLNFVQRGFIRQPVIDDVSPPTNPLPSTPDSNDNTTPPNLTPPSA